MDENKPQNPSPSYKVIKLLGEGSYGKAYLVERYSDKEVLVLKSINMERMSEKDQKDAKQEAKILEKMDHSNIIKIHDFFISHRPRLSLNIITEYADGGDLGQKIKAQPKAKPFTESQILDYFTQICLAIKHIHNKKIIHRDLKSQNIFLTMNGLVKLGDFGIAKSLDCTWQKAMTMIGTPYYLSPEVVQSKPYSFKSDIWSLGVLLYEMMALKMPFDATSLPMLSLKIMKGNFPPPPNIYTKDLRVLVMSMLHVEENKRPTASEILRLPFIKSRIKNFLDEVEYNKEFSKTIVKSYKNQIKQQTTKKNSLSNQNTKNQTNSTGTTNATNTNESACLNHNSNKMNLYNVLVSNSKKTEKNSASQQQTQQNNPVHQYQHNQPQQQNFFQKPHFNSIQQVSLIQKIKKKEEGLNNKMIQQQDNPIKRQYSHGFCDNISNKNPNSSIKVSQQHNELQNFLKKCREEMKNKVKSEDVCQWPNNNLKSPKVSSDEKQSKFPKIIILEQRPSYHQSSNNLIKIPEDPKTKEEEYNANRFLNHLSKIVIEDKEDSDNEETEDLKQSESSSMPEETIRDLEELQLETENQDQKMIITEPNQTIQMPINLMTDYSQIEEMKMELEQSLGVELFKTLYHCVDSSTDPKNYTCDYAKIGEKIKSELIAKKYKQKDIDLSFEKIPEVFSIVTNDRISNMALY